MQKFCNRCKLSISEQVYDYSTENFFKPLCIKHQPTPEATKLGHLLKNKGWYVEFEKYDRYKHIDIAIVKAKVNIEIDGKQHQKVKQALADLKRTYYSFMKGFITLRIPNCLVRDEKTIETTAKFINEFLNESKEQLKES